jgi:glucokinase-like ROK family protein
MSEANFLGSNINHVKEHNLRAILRSLLYDGPLSRIQLAKKTALSATTITNLVDGLIEKKIVSEYVEEIPSEPRGVGRPQSRLCLNGKSRFAIGVQMRVGVYRVALVDLLGQVVDYIEAGFASSTPARSVIEEIAHAIEEILLRHHIDRNIILGIGVGAAGLVNYATGVNILSTNLGWENIPIRDWLIERLNLPVVVDNNVKAMALAEAYFGSGRNASSLVFIYGRAGVGSGIVVGNRLLRGADLGAGEIGHMIIIAEGGKKCRCGQSGCLETLVSEPALIQQAQELCQAHPDSLMAQYLRIDPGQPLDQVFKAAREGDPFAKEMIECSARYLGIALANIVNLLNPEMIVLGGLYHQGRDLILPIARETLENTAFAGLGKKVKLTATGFGWQAGIVGAAVLVITAFFLLSPEEI